MSRRESRYCRHLSSLCDISFPKQQPPNWACKFFIKGISDPKSRSITIEHLANEVSYSDAIERALRYSNTRAEYEEFASHLPFGGYRNNSAQDRLQAPAADLHLCLRPGMILQRLWCAPFC